LNIGDRETLADLAAEVGLDHTAALAALESDAFAADVDADIAAARQLGISGVPFFVLNGRFAVSGAQPVEVFSEALAKAWAER
jgi:predicted DsbA family dithiol-disulfide isomerase